MKQCFMDALSAEKHQGSNQGLEGSRSCPTKAPLQTPRKLLARSFSGQATLDRRLLMRSTAYATAFVELGTGGWRIDEGGLGFQAQEAQ
jgi:hypothetical protein